MSAPRIFYLGGGPSPADIIDRAASRTGLHAVRTVAHRSPAGAEVRCVVELVRLCRQCQKPVGRDRAPFCSGTCRREWRAT